MADNDILKGIREHWSLLLQVSALILGSILLFVLAPPRLTPANDSATWVQLVKFVGAILLAVTIVGIRRSNERVGRLQFITVSMVVAALASFFAYQRLVAAWTCGNYDGRGPIVIGSKLLPEAARDFPNGTSACEMVQDVAGHTASLWPQAQLDDRYLILAATFLLTALLFLAAAIVAVEMVRAMADPPTRRRGGRG